MQKKANIKYILAVLLFGSNGIFAMQISLNSYEIVFLRAMLGSLFLFAVFFLSRRKLDFLNRQKRQLLFIILSGIAMGTSWMFLYEAYQQIGVGIATLLYYCGPVIVMALSPILFRERLTWLKGIAFFVVLCGILLINGQAIQHGTTFWGLFCGGMSAVTYAVMVIFNKRAKDIIGLENAVIQLVVGFLTVAVFVGIKQGYTFQIGNNDWLPILILGLLNTGIGCYLYFSSISKLPVQTIAVCGYLEALSAVVLSIIVLREAMLAIQVLGGILIISGAIFGEWISSTEKVKNNE